MKSDGYHDSVPVCNTEYDLEVIYEDGRWLWSVNATDYDYDGEEIGTGGVFDGACSTEAEALLQAEAHLVRARELAEVR